jgi:two-component system sensor histidine kinase BarA
MDGITATKTIRKKEQGTSDPAIIIAITAHAFQEQTNKFLNLGFDGVLTKPFSKRDLIQALVRYTTKQMVEPPPSEMGNKAIGYCLENDKAQDIPESLTELLPQIFKTITTDFNVIKEALACKNYPDIYRACHNLTGVCGMFGFRGLATLFADLSHNVKAQNYILADELIRTLETYLSQLQKAQQIATISD